LGLAVAGACQAARADSASSFRFLYPLSLSLKDKIQVICKEIYGADGADFSELAESRLEVHFVFLVNSLIVECLLFFRNRRTPPRASMHYQFAWPKPNILCQQMLLQR
jgi:hypothetical protein